MLSKIPNNIFKILDSIYKKTIARSLFLYGSRVRDDYLPESDYEIGIIFNRAKKWSRDKLAHLNSYKSVNIYPFIYEDLVKYHLDSPFPKKIYLRELTGGGATTLFGQKVLETLTPPEVRLSDLLELTNFELGYALATLLAIREDAYLTAQTTFTKSVFYAFKALIILKLKKLPISYREIDLYIDKITLEPKFKDLYQTALKVRNGKKLELSKIYANLTFLNEVILVTIKKKFAKGDEIILTGKKI